MSLLRPLAVAFAFLTRLPVPTGSTEDADTGRSLVFFPVVGVALGMALVTVSWIASALPSPITAVLVVAVLAALTGGLHLDGVADVFDGVSGGHGDRERILAIMRDSHIGAHGALALLLVVLAKVAALSTLLQRHALWVVIVFPAMARWSVVLLIVAFPYLRNHGLGRAFSDHGGTHEVLWATAFVVGLLLWLGPPALAPTLTALGAALAFGAWMRWRVGGLTGDGYGAAIELAEVAFLIAASRGA